MDLVLWKLLAIGTFLCALYNAVCAWGCLINNSLLLDMYQLRKQQFRHHLFLLIQIFNEITNIRANLIFLLLGNGCFLKISMQQLMVFSFILHRKCRLSEGSLWDTWVCGSRSYKLWTYWIWNRYVEYRSYLLHFVSTFLFLNSQILTVAEHTKCLSTSEVFRPFLL